MKDRRGSAGSISCISHSSLSVADVYKKQPAAAAAPPNYAAVGGAEEEKAVAALGLVAAGVQRLIKGIKSMFAVAAGEEDEEEEEEEEEIVIGYPTDVVHVGHIGWDGGRLSNAGALQLQIAAAMGASSSSTPSSV